MLQARRIGLQSSTTRVTAPSARIVTAARRSPASRKSAVMVSASTQQVQPIRSAKEGFERFLSSAAYFLPLADGFDYGRFLFSSYPIFYDFFSPIKPLINDFNSYQYAALLTFFLLLVGVVMNTRLSRFTRVHAMQALVLEGIVFIPRLIESVIYFNHGAIYQTTQSGIWLFVASCVVVSSVAALLGNRVWLPLVSSSAEARL